MSGRRVERGLRRGTAVFLALLMGLGPGVSRGAEQVPPWMEPDVLKAAVDIGMTTEQSVQFRDALTTFVNAQILAINRIIQRGVANQDHKIRSKTRSLIKDMDKTMRGVLTEEQYPRYEVYRDRLMDRMGP